MLRMARLRMGASGCAGTAGLARQAGPVTAGEQGLSNITLAQGTGTMMVESMVQRRQQARLRSIGAHLGLGGAGLKPAAAAPFVGNDSQGLGIRAAAQPPIFNPQSQHDEAFEFWQEHGFVVVAALSVQEVAEMNAAADEGWLKHYAHEQGELMVFYPLLDYPEVDKFCNHENTMPLISQMLVSTRHAHSNSMSREVLTGFLCFKI